MVSPEALPTNDAVQSAAPPKAPDTHLLLHHEHHAALALLQGQCPTQAQACAQCMYIAMQMWRAACLDSVANQFVGMISKGCWRCVVRASPQELTLELLQRLLCNPGQAPSRNCAHQ